MKSLLLVTFVCILEFCSANFNDGQTFFRHRENSVERRSPVGNSDALKDMTRRWLKRYYRNTNSELQQNPENYDVNTPDEFRWLIENVGNLNQNAIRFPSEDGMKREDEGQDFNNLYEEAGRDDSSDVYNLATLLNGRVTLEPSFEQALREYLMQESKQDQSTDAVSQHESDQKKASRLPIDLTSTEPNVVKTTPAPTESLSKATDVPVTSTKSSNSLSVMPPVHVGKGQKEYPMLRPASENGRKFDGWPESLQESMITSGNNIGLPRFLIQKKDSHRDIVREELDKLKIRTRRSLKQPYPVFF